MMMNYTSRLEELDRILRTLYEEEFEKYCAAFSSNLEFTSFIRMIVEKLASAIQLRVLHEYYSIDHVFYKDEDIIKQNAHTWSMPPHSLWLKHFRIIMEHENHLEGRSGGYQEVSHLMVTNADAKVLVGYGNNYDNYDFYAIDYQAIMRELDYEPQPILFIGEYSPFFNSPRAALLRLESYIISKKSIRKFNDKINDWETISIK